MSPRVAQTLADVAKETGVPLEVLLGPSRLRLYAYPRHLAMARVRALVRANGSPAFSYPAIGKIFNRDHSSVIDGVRGHEKRNGPIALRYPILECEETKL